MVARQTVEPQQNADMYCAHYGEYYPENQYYIHGAPPEMCHAHVCPMQGEFCGPVTVPMVSTNSSPPIAMPVQVPPGHVVQQIVDESGTLRHVILSPQPPAGLVAMPSPNTQHFGAGPGGGGSNQAQQYYQGLATGFPPPHYHAGIPPGHPGPSPTHLGHSPPPNQYYKDERTQRQYIKLKKKIHDKKLDSNCSSNINNNSSNSKKLSSSSSTLTATSTSTSSTASSTSSSSASSDLINGFNNKRTTPTTLVAKDKEMNSVGTSEDGEESSIPDEEDSVQIIADILSSVQAPKVSELSSRSALLQWAPPTKLSDPSNNEPHEIDFTDLRYEVLLSDKSKEMKFKSIYNGPSLSCRIQDLRPGQEYSVCLQVHYEELQGAATDPIKFTTPPCEPDQPQPPKLHQRLKNSLHLRWNAVNDNGAHILNYILEYDEGKNGEFIEFHRTKVRQHTLHKLQPATAYRFRLAAVNDVGKSLYSDIVTYDTCNNAPLKPVPPVLTEASVNSLTLQWTSRPKDDEFTLQMNDPKTKYYLPVYNGRDKQYVCTRLNSFTEYKFRLRAENDGGQSPWSDEVMYKTLPDCPSRPSKPIVKGRIHAHSFKLKWEAPSDSGGAEITKYILEVNSGSGYEIVYTGLETEAVCDKLTPGTTYQLRVSCLSAGGTSNYSEPCTVTTDAVCPGECSQPKLYGKPKSNCLTIRWSEPDYNGGAPILEYNIEMTNLNNNNNNITTNNNGGSNINNSISSSRYFVVVNKSKEMEYNAMNLLPGCDYEFCVRAVNRIGPGNWSERLKVTSGAAPPEMPQQPTVLCKSPFHIFVEWVTPITNGAPIIEYKLEMSTSLNSNTNCNTNSQCDEQFNCVYQGVETSYDVKGLLPFTKYYFRVLASNIAGASPFSPVSVTLTPAAPPGPITTLRSDSTPTSIHLHWSEPITNGSPITHYNIELADRLLQTEGPINEYVLDNLQPDTHYKIKIQAVNNVGNGPLSATLRTATLRLPPTAPKLECIGIGHNYLKLKWGDGKNLDYTQYTIELESLRSKEFQCCYKGTAFTYKVNKLHELTTYKFRINASNDAGTGEFSDTYEFTTGITPPCPVKTPKLVEVEQRCCTIEWLPVRNSFMDPVIYQVQIGRMKEQIFKQVYKGAEVRCLIEDLEPGTDYSVRVCPIRAGSTGELSGAWSPQLTVSTIALEPILVQKSSPTNSSSPSHLHKSRTTLNSLLHMIRLRRISDQPVFYALLIMIVGIIISIWIMSFF